MIIKFYEGVLKRNIGESKSLVWAQSELGCRALVGSQIKTWDTQEIRGITDVSMITSVDLEGLESEDAIYVIDSILKGKYYAKPGVRGILDAALYLLVNEALTELSRPVYD
ncbi:MAG: hypothetical protein NTY51_05950 [Deltaproteobacteria bacterium]|nr:hypothetical protein [Deltaproteobacteria bacterium]